MHLKKAKEGVTGLVCGTVIAGVWCLHTALDTFACEILKYVHGAMWYIADLYVV